MPRYQIGERKTIDGVTAEYVEINGKPDWKIIHAEPVASHASTVNKVGDRRTIDGVTGEYRVVNSKPDWVVVSDRPEQPGDTAKQAAGFMLQDNPALPWQARVGQFLGRQVAEHPVASAATAGAMLAAPVAVPAGLAATTGPFIASLVPGMLGAAGGAGVGSTIEQLWTGKPKTASDVLNTMAVHGATNALGEGIGQGVMGGLRMASRQGLRRLVPELTGQSDEFANLVDVAQRERIPMDEFKKAHDLGSGPRGSGRTDYLLQSHDRMRPAVKGLLPEGTHMVPTGAPPEPPPIQLRVAHAQAKPLMRPPESTMPGGGRFAEHLPGDPVETQFTSRQMTPQGSHLDPLLPSAPLAGPGMMRVPLNAPPGKGAYPQMVDPEEIAAGFARVRAQLDKAGDKDGVREMDALIAKFRADNPDPMTTFRTKEMVRTEHAKANPALRAYESGQGTNVTDARPKYHMSIAREGNRILREKIPAIKESDQYAMEMIGLGRALKDASKRALNQHQTTLMNPLSWASPNTWNKAMYLANAPVVGRIGPTVEAGRNAVMDRLADLLLKNGALGRTGTTGGSR